MLLLPCCSYSRFCPVCFLCCLLKAFSSGVCPAGVELLFAKQGFLSPSLFGARILCYSPQQRAYINEYGVPTSLTEGQIIGIAVGSAVAFILLVVIVILLINYCYKKKSESDTMHELSTIANNPSHQNE